MAANVRRSCDDTLMELLVESKTLVGFLHTIFEFLSRRTDFYYVTKESGEGVGFPPGAAEKLVLKILKKCNPNAPIDDNNISSQCLDPSRFLPTLVAEEVEIMTTDDENSKTNMSLNEFTVEYPLSVEDDLNSRENCFRTSINNLPDENTSPDLDMQSLSIDCDITGNKILDSDISQNKSTAETSLKCEDHLHVRSSSDVKVCNVKNESKYQDSEAYNGAITDYYSWAQTIGELDVTIKLPECVKISKQLKINITSGAISVQYCTAESWIPLIEDKFSFNIKQGETVWVMSEGYIRIHLEKQKERWWHALVKSEPAMDTSKLDCSRPLHELPEDHIDKVRELQHNQMMKMAGKPTSDDVRQRELLKKAWHEPGSPFAGTEFDPNIPILK